MIDARRRCMVSKSSDRRRSHIVGLFHRFGWQRRFWERAIRDVTFDSSLRLNFYIALDAANDFDGLAAFQLCGQIEIHHRFVDPHTVFIHGAFNVDARRFRIGDATEARDYENCSKRPNHFPSASVRGLEISGRKMPCALTSKFNTDASLMITRPHCPGNRARMASQIVRPGARREPHGDLQGYRSQIVRNGLFSMTRSESGAQLTERPENGQ
jgi:hypothetical protein